MITTQKVSLIGVNVIISNTKGTTTDINGNFNLKKPKDENNITFKYIGYKTYTTDFTGESEFLIKMKPESSTNWYSCNFWKV